MVRTVTPTKKSDSKPKEPTSTTMATTAKPETPKAPAPTPAAQPQQPLTANKQTATVAKLKAAWLERGIKFDQLAEKQDGKFILLQPTPDWPIIRVGPTGGIELPQIRSYAKAWDAALDGFAIWQKQQARDQKKANTAKPAPPPAAKPQPTPAAKPDTPTARKQKRAPLARSLSGVVPPEVHIVHDVVFPSVFFRSRSSRR
jgi:hypothetical protein